MTREETKGDRIMRAASDAAHTVACQIAEIDAAHAARAASCEIAQIVVSDPTTIPAGASGGHLTSVHVVFKDDPPYDAFSHETK